MEGINTTFTSLIVIAIIFVIVLVVCHILKPRAIAWIQSNGEEKISLSKNKLYHANGYMIQSNSDILLGSTGSFKRFDSVDRDYKQIGQSSSTSPTWNIPITETHIPPQPLRPAPAPIPLSGTKINKINYNKQFDDDFKIIKQHQSLDRLVTSSAIPRPTAKRQLSTPTTSTSTPLNLSSNIFNIPKLPRLCTNPFLNGTIEPNESKTLIHETNSEFLRQSSLPNQRNTISSSPSPSLTTSTPSPKNPFTISTPSSAHSSCSVIDKKYFSFEKIKENFNENQETDNLLLKENEIKEEDDVFSCYDNKQNFFSIFSNFNNSDDTTRIKDIKNNSKKFYNDDNRSLIQLNDAATSTLSLNELQLKQSVRARSLSETDFLLDSQQQRFLIENDLIEQQNSTNLLIKTKLHKTLSENYLEQYNLGKVMKNGTKKYLHRENSLKSLGSNCSSESIDILDETSTNSFVQRAISCESVTSQSSILLSDLETPSPVATGCLCIGLQYDKNSVTDLGQELIVTILEAKELIGPVDTDLMNTFVRIYMVPDETGPVQTKIFKNSVCPSYNESFSFWMNRKETRRSLWFHLYHTNSQAHTLIGEAEMKLNNISHLPVTTWLALSDSKHNKKNVNGELMFSLSYLPTAERLTIVVVKARNLKINNTIKNCNQDNSLIDNNIDSNNNKNIYVKVYLLKNNKKVSKKKTMLKKNELSPIYNESMIFSVPPYMLNSIQIRVTVVCTIADNLSYNSSCDKNVVGNSYSIGHVIVGGGTSGKGLRHWHQMLSSLRKPVAMWHPLRLTNNNVL